MSEEIENVLSGLSRDKAASIREVKIAIKSLSDDERLILFEHLEDGFCRDCGTKLDNPPNCFGTCHCTNDE